MEYGQTLLPKRNKTKHTFDQLQWAATGHNNYVSNKTQRNLLKAHNTFPEHTCKYSWHATAHYDNKEATTPFGVLKSGKLA